MLLAPPAAHAPAPFAAPPTCAVLAAAVSAAAAPGTPRDAPVALCSVASVPATSAHTPPSTRTPCRSCSGTLAVAAPCWIPGKRLGACALPRAGAVSKAGGAAGPLGRTAAASLRRFKTDRAGTGAGTCAEAAPAGVLAVVTAGCVGACQRVPAASLALPSESCPCCCI